MKKKLTLREWFKKKGLKLGETLIPKKIEPFKTFNGRGSNIPQGFGDNGFIN